MVGGMAFGELNKALNQWNGIALQPVVKKFAHDYIRINIVFMM